MTSKNSSQKSGVARLRERFFERKEKVRPSKELEEALRKDPPAKETSEEKNKIAASHPRKRDLEIG